MSLGDSRIRSCEFCKYLLGEAYCYPNVKDIAEVTPLHSACE